MKSRQKSKTALVTGGTRGIGLGIAKSLANEGWNLVLNGMRPEESVQEVLEELRSKEIEVAYAQGDIGSDEGRNAVREAARKASEAQSVNLLVNNAGVAPKDRPRSFGNDRRQLRFRPRYQLEGTLLSDSRHRSRYGRSQRIGS